MSEMNWPVLVLRVTADADPGVLARVVARFQNLNLVPRRVIAEWGLRDCLYIEVEIAGIAAETLSQIAVRLAQIPSVHEAYWHR